MKNPKIKLHGFSPLDRSGKVRWVLEELGLPFEYRELDYEKGETDSMDFLAMNPMGAVPVMEFEDIVMHESDAICAFLAESFPAGKLMPDVATPARAKCLQWMCFQEATLGVAKNYSSGINDGTEGLETEAAKKLRADADDHLKHCLRALETELSSKSYLCGEFSVADISVTYSLSWTEKRGGLKDFPVLQEYVARNKARPAAVRAGTFNKSE